MWAPIDFSPKSFAALRCSDWFTPLARSPLTDGSGAPVLRKDRLVANTITLPVHQQYHIFSTTDLEGRTAPRIRKPVLSRRFGKKRRFAYQHYHITNTTIFAALQILKKGQLPTYVSRRF